ncbi:hypothetical protein Mpal_2645 [Methanosphaerula palustris E1-9c]|uniref:Uncharacterized protein n=2 Tax=Methanosphaerula palustris TaxID=475088 RepID=B8GFM6_METPE|nr:hypothetical protein Mpal_2645 [Methanosphaerula palustris E1-9c]
MTEKKGVEKEAEEIPFRGMERDPLTDTDKQSTGEKPPDEEFGYWIGMNPEDSSDTDMNKSRFAVWPDGEMGEETISSASIKKSEISPRSAQEVTEKMEQIGHELHGSEEIVLPGGAARTPDPGAGEMGGRKSSGDMDFTTRVRKGDDGRNPDDWRIVSHKSEQGRHHAEDDLKKQPKHDL